MPSDENVKDDINEVTIPQHTSKALQLSNLEWWISDEDLISMIREVGCVESLIAHEIGFLQSPVNGKSRGECYLKFQDETSAVSAYKYFVQQKIKVEFSDAIGNPFIGRNGTQSNIKIPQEAGRSKSPPPNERDHHRTRHRERERLRDRERDNDRYRRRRSRSRSRSRDRRARREYNNYRDRRDRDYGRDLDRDRYGYRRESSSSKRNRSKSPANHVSKASKASHPSEKSSSKQSKQDYAGQSSDSDDLVSPNWRD